MDKSEVYRIPPYHYVHVLDVNTNVTRVISGPVTYVCGENEELVYGPSRMVVIPPRHFVTIENPVCIDADTGDVLFDESTGQVMVAYGQQEIRLSQPPFALFPGEKLASSIKPLTMVEKNSALRLLCLQDFPDGSRTAGEMWLFEGPSLYVPNVDVDVVEVVKAIVIKKNEALRLKATQNTKDMNGVDRVTGEEWLWRVPGMYLPSVFEEIVGRVQAIALTDTKAVHMRATFDFVDQFERKRDCGSTWLVTKKDTECYIPSVNELKVCDVDLTVLTSREFTIIVNPFNSETGKIAWGKRKLVTGPTSFFLHPKENLLNGVESVYVLREDEGLIMKADEPCEYNGKLMRAGERWTISGPAEYVPPVECSVIRRVSAIALDSNEGVYVRNLKTGEVRAVIGETAMLTEDEALYEKEVPRPIEDLLIRKGALGDIADVHVREKTQVIRYHVPHNSAVQIYDYRKEKARVVFGPALVQLEPDEMFTPLSLSGGKPKQPNRIRSLHLLLGPDFSTDIITVETSDHARLNLKLSYNWRFQTEFEKPEMASALFSVADFVGDMCNAMASRIRGAVASRSFDEFHKNNAAIIKEAVFGDEGGHKFFFSANFLEVSEVDVKSIEPVDSKTRDALQKAVQLAIQITTDSQEASARQDAERLDQEAIGQLERSKIDDACQAEKNRIKLTDLQAQTRAVETAGLAKAVAQSEAEALSIAATSAVDEASLVVQAKETTQIAELDAAKQRADAESSFKKQKYELTEKHAEKLSEISTLKFKSMIETIGASTIKDMTLSQKSAELAMLRGLKLSSTVVTDGTKPLSLRKAARQIIEAEDSILADEGLLRSMIEAGDEKSDADDMGLF